MKSYRCDDWSHLAGTKVEIYRHGQLVRAGVIDAVMPDGTLLWLAGDHSGSRTLFESAAGYEVWADPYNPPDELHPAIFCQQSPTTMPDVEDQL